MKNRIVATLIAAFVTTIIGAFVWQQSTKATDLEIFIWEEEQPAIQNVLDEVITLFETQNPGTRIKRSHFGTEDLRSQFLMAGIGGQGPELILAPNDFAGVFRKAGIIQSIETWMDMRKFSPQTVEAISTSDGKSYGAPINLGNHLILYVNKKLRPNVPNTIEELIKPSKFNNPDQTQYDLAFNHLEPFWFVPFLGAFDENPLIEKDGQTVPNLNTNATVAALEILSAMKFKSRIIPNDCDYACAETLFLEGKAAMTINGDWAIGLFQSALGDDLVIAPLPKLEKSDKAMRPMVAGKYLMLRSGLKEDKEELARAFTEFLVSETIQRFLTERSKRLPSLRSLLSDPIVTNDPYLSASLAAIKHAQPMPMAVELRAVWDAIRPQLQEVMAGRTHSAQAAEQMQRDAEQKIRMLGR